MTLSEFFTRNPDVALAFSGGTDSAYLLWAAVKNGANVRPYYVNAAFQPAFELEDAQKLCSQLGVSLRVIEADVLSDPVIVSNPQDRCYYCKHAIFSALSKAAAEDGYRILLDGTNASDDAADRPGMRALEELHVLSPLRLCGLTKAQIREESKKAGLFTHDKPAYACLATRIPTGDPITAGLLQRIEQSENALFALGFTDFRVRVFHDAARIQLPQAQFALACEKREKIRAALKPFFETILLDTEVR